MMHIEKTFIIGDIHGCLHLLKRLVEKIAWRPDKDRLIFLGDYLDRGEDSKGVVEYILGLTRRSPHIDCLIGNHEAMFLDYLSGINQMSYLNNGGWSTLESYDGRLHTIGNIPPIPPEHMAFFHSLKPYVELENFYVVHAGFRPNVAIKKQSLEDMIWIRDEFIDSDYDFGKRVIFGHTPMFDGPLIMKNKIGIDTGAVYGHSLTCLELPEIKFHSVEV